MVAMPDINTLIAAAWPNHIHHGLARSWITHETVGGWATCPMTQAGFIRISMNPKVVGSAVDFATAAAVLRRYTEDEHHCLWHGEATPTEWPEWLAFRVQGYRQVTDATLLATAISNDGFLVSLDAGILTLLPDSERERVHVLVPA